MGIKGGKNGNNNGFGNLCNLKPVITAATAEEDTDNIPNTRIIRISEQMYRRFVGHSKKYYNIESYNTILENLIQDFERNHKDSSWRDINES